MEKSNTILGSTALRKKLMSDPRFDVDHFKNKRFGLFGPVQGYVRKSVKTLFNQCTDKKINYFFKLLRSLPNTERTILQYQGGVPPLGRYFKFFKKPLFERGSKNLSQSLSYNERGKVNQKVNKHLRSLTNNQNPFSKIMGQSPSHGTKKLKEIF